MPSLRMGGGDGMKILLAVPKKTMAIQNLDRVPMVGEQVITNGGFLNSKEGLFEITRVIHNPTIAFIASKIDKAETLDWFKSVMKEEYIPALCYGIEVE